MTKRKRRHPSVMDAAEYNAIMTRLGLMFQIEQAAFLGVAQRTAHGYANGGNIPIATAKLLRLVDRLKLPPGRVA